VDETVVQALAALWHERSVAPTGADIARSAPVTRRWRARWEAAQQDADWVERNRLRDIKRREVVPAIQELLRGFIGGSVALDDFGDIFHRRSMNEWDLFGLKGAAGLLLNTLVKDLPDAAVLSAQLAACLERPADEQGARQKLEAFAAYLDEQITAGLSTTRRIGPKRIKFLASACWHMFDIEAWPPLYPSARKALEADGLLNETPSIADSYLEYREVFLSLAAALGLSSWELEHLCDREADASAAGTESPPQSGTEDEEDTATRERVWLVAPGPSAAEWEHFRADGIIAIGWDYLGDLTRYPDLDAIRSAIQEHEGTGINPVHDALACHQFVSEMQVGDKIFAKKGRHEIVGYGVITSEYRHEPARGEYGQVRSVEWKRAGSWVPRKKPLVTKTLTEIGQYPGLVADIQRALGITNSIHPGIDGPPTPSPVYGMSDALQEVFLLESDLAEAVELLRYKKNVVLQGPPGVGKTFIASRLARLLLGASDNQRVTQVQFHQSYSYEDFIQGFRPTENGQFRLVDGPFLRVCEQALQDPDLPYVLVIDEINRGNLSKIFGELLLLIEADKRSKNWSVNLTYSAEPFHVPSNLYVIGTMNTADRSLALVDYALRRRFAFIPIHPALDHPLFAQLLTDLGATPALQGRIVQRISGLNRRICEDPNLGDGFAIGHSYFCHAPKGSDADLDWYRRIVRTEIAPLLREYWFDDRERAREETARLLADD
ncbi:MAG TPA: AAA family ATPase, partial [Polyangiaceae bacterium]|nr:AAA family ATPase [Polyangiaceae bacterium]